MNEKNAARNFTPDEQKILQMIHKLTPDDKTYFLKLANRLKREKRKGKS